MATDTKSQFEPHIGRSVSLDHAAQLLGVSRRTIYNRIRDNRLKTVRTAGGSQRVLIDSLAGRRAADRGDDQARLARKRNRGGCDEGATTDHLGRRVRRDRKHFLLARDRTKEQSDERQDANQGRQRRRHHSLG